VPAPASNAALFFHPAGYDLAGSRLVGRVAAGHGFLRAAVAGRGDEPLVGYGPSRDLQTPFEALVRAIDPAAATEWIQADGLERLAERGACHRPDLVLGGQARLRLRVGQAAYSLTGVTHTLATERAMSEIADTLRDPLAEWDALICTSSAALEIAQRVHAEEAEYLRWRLGPDVQISGPQLPVIPLGVHSADFDFAPGLRSQARAAVGVAEDEVVALYVGRLVPHAKADPIAMLQGLQAAAQRTGKPVALVFYGQAPTPEILAAFRSAAAQFAPDLNAIFLDGQKVEAATAWACGDIFVSLADGIQETFGLTPIEAMAAGLPAVVSDWNGYKDTVRDGVDGFRIRTWAPAPGAGVAIARAYETGTLNYDVYCWATGASTAIDIAQLTDRLAALIDSPDLRRTLGAAGRARARHDFDWAAVYRQYQALWAELGARRRAALANPDRMARIAAAPRSGSAHPDPFRAFAHYPSASIAPGTAVRLAPGASTAALDAVLDHILFRDLSTPHDLLRRIWGAIESGADSVQAVSVATNLNMALVARAVGTLAKVGVVSLA
jgi:glycosyltransferase involved in cell wall biosynthesis